MKKKSYLKLGGKKDFNVYFCWDTLNPQHSMKSFLTLLVLHHHKEFTTLSILFPLLPGYISLTVVILNYMSLLYYEAHLFLLMGLQIK